MKKPKLKKSGTKKAELQKIPEVHEVYQELYHYTNMSGAIGILESQNMWATHLKFMNDTSEGQIAQKILEETTYPHIMSECKKLIKAGKLDEDKINADGGLETLVTEEVALMVDIFHRSMGGEFYITSLSGETTNLSNIDEEYMHKNGRLSQWRGYGENGGIALVFDTKELQDALWKEAKSFSMSIGIGDVFYIHENKVEDENLKEEFSVLLKNYVSLSMYQLRNAYFGENLEYNDNILDNGYNALLHSLTRFKHHSFKEEKEVRIYIHHAPIEPCSTQNKKPVKLRDGATPYIELFSTDNSPLPIKRIIVGPHKDKEKRAEGLRIMFPDIDITISDIPYIG